MDTPDETNVEIMSKLPNPGKRATEEWIGKMPDTPVPSYVKLRVYERHGGFCHIAKRKILAGEPWDMEHVKAICNGGENRESNLAPALADKHKGKTAKDRAIKAQTDKSKKKHIGITKQSGWNRTYKGRPVTHKVGGGVVYADTGEPV